MSTMVPSVQIHAVTLTDISVIFSKLKCRDLFFD